MTDEIFWGFIALLGINVIQVVYLSSIWNRMLDWERGFIRRENIHEN